MNVLNSVCFFVFSLSSLGAGFFIASAHPASPWWATLAFLGFFSLFLWKSRLGLVSLPVFLPVLNFAPWTGWLIFDEFDLLVLAVLAAGYLRQASDRSRLERRGAFLFLLALVVLPVAQAFKGVDAQDLHWFSGYTTSLNSLRVGKSLLWVVLLFPLAVQSGRGPSANGAIAGFFGACLLGSCWVVLAVFWERAFFPGLLDVSTPYRTVALFWEMHQGGAALDAYLVLIAPLLVWAWRATSSVSGRLAIGAFVQVFVYVCLTTFSRGVLGAIAGSLVLLAALLVWQRVGSGQHWRAFNASSAIVLLLAVLEIALMLGTDSFMSRRLAASERDFGGRLQHWEESVALLKSPEDWLFGIGLGKFPARVTAGEAGLALPGAFYRHEDNGHPSMVIMGPDGPGSRNVGSLGGLYALSQRVGLVSGHRYRFAMEVRSETMAVMLVQVCAQHLLYPAGCQWRKIRLNPGGWQHLESTLSGNAFKADSWQSAGHGVLSLSVLTPGARVEAAGLQLSAGGGNLVRNGDFAQGAAGWFPAARSYFLPWHIDNLYLEFLIETGLIGLSGFLALVCWIIWRLFLAYRRGNEFAPYLISCVAGLMALGLVVSVLDMPRVATLFGLFLVSAWQCCGVESDACRK